MNDEIKVEFEQARKTEREAKQELLSARGLVITLDARSDPFSGDVGSALGGELAAARDRLLAAQSRYDHAGRTIATLRVKIGETRTGGAGQTLGSRFDPHTGRWIDVVIAPRFR